MSNTIKNEETTREYMMEMEKTIKNNIICYFDNCNKETIKKYKVLIYHQYEGASFSDKEKEIQLWSQQGFNVIVLYTNDHLERFKTDPLNVLIFRNSLDNTNHDVNERPMPYILLDNSISAFPTLQKGSKPRVAFCGCNITHPERKKGLSLLSQSMNVICNFIIRENFWNGTMYGIKNIFEFFENMRECEFVYCPRGAGTFSMRFYETLQKGRIPVITKDTPLPFERFIDWTKVCVIADTVDSLVNAIVEFWNANDIVHMQHKCRKIYEDYFTKGELGRNFELEARSYFLNTRLSN